MKDISSAFWLAMQQPDPNMCDLIDLTTTAQTHRFTTNNQAMVSSGNVYLPFPGRAEGGIEESTDLGVSHLSFTVSNTGHLPGELTKTHILDFADIVISRVFVSSPDLGRLELFRGELGNYSYNRNFVAGQARDLFGANLLWPYYTYQNQCVWRFGSFGCGFDTSSITIAGSLAVNSSTRQILFAASGTLVNSFIPGKLEFGKVTITSGVNSGQVRTVMANTGDLVTLSHILPFSHETAGVTFSVFPGCRKRLLEDCHSTYNHSSAYLGFPWIPKQVVG